MDKILFVVPPNINYQDFINPPENVKSVSKSSSNYGAVITDIPLGVLSLSAYIKKNTEIQTRLIDFNVVINKLDDFGYISFEDLFMNYLSAPSCKDFEPSIIAISVLFITSYHNMLDIAKCCRDIFPNTIIIAGGGVPTNMYKDLFRDSTHFDALCYGEGEKLLLGLVESEDKLRYLEETPSWITQKNVNCRLHVKHEFVENLDEIPLLDYGILDKDGYGLSPTISAYTSINEKRNSIPVMTSRGCTHQCCFCSSHTVHGRSMRYHSINRVREDLIILKDRYDVKTIVFQDDHFLANKRRAFEIIDILGALQLTAFFPNSLALYALDRKMLEALKSVGVFQLVLSVESGSYRVLREIMHKPLNLDIVKRVARDCRDLGIYTDVNILIGLPGETKQDIEDTRKFLKTIEANWFRINVATPLVGSEMFDICIDKGYLMGSYIDCNYKKAIVNTEDFTPQYIQEMAYVMNLEINFVANSDFRLGRYEIALKGFENAIRAKNDHAVAYFCAAKCYEKLLELEKAELYMDTAKNITFESSYWRKYLELLNISF